MPETRKASIDESRMRDIINEEMKNVFRAEILSFRSSFEQQVKETIRQSIQSEFEELKAEIQRQKQEIDSLKKVIITLEERRLNDARKELSCNIVIRGISEFDDETESATLDKVNEILKHPFPDIKTIKAERIGRNNVNNSRNRAIKVKLESRKMRNTVLRNARNYRESSLKNIFIDADRTFLDRKESYRLRQKMKDLRTQFPTKNIRIERGTLKMDDDDIDFEYPLRHLFPCP